MPGRGLRRALGCNLYSYTHFREWYGELACQRCWLEAEVDVGDGTAAYVRQLFWRRIIPGFDGSLLGDNDDVFVVNPRRETDYLTMRKVDYWHDVVGDKPICHATGEMRHAARSQRHAAWLETSGMYAADGLISPCRGFTVQCGTYLPRRWRRWLIKSLVFPRHPRLHIHAELIASFLH